jgi:cytochrome c biogenesis protein CcdA
VDGLPLTLALGAGMLAAVNPCGFALLPAYLSLLVANRAYANVPVALTRALGATAAMTLGFVLVFGAFGLLATSVAGWLQGYLPWFTVGLGVAVAILGGWLLAGHELPFGLWRAGRAPAVTRSAVAMIVFGAAYALASLSCAVGPFLAVVTTSLQRSLWDGLLLYVAYAIGMGLLIGATAVTVAFARTALIGRLRRLAPVVSRGGGAVMVVAGLYVAYYGWYERRILGGDLSTDPIVSAATNIQRWFAAIADHVGTVTVVAIVTIVLGLVAIVVRAAGQRRARRPPEPGP